MEQKQPVSLEELTLSNTYSIEAVVKLLIRKGLITQEEILEELRMVRDEQMKKVN